MILDLDVMIWALILIRRSNEKRIYLATLLYEAPAFITQRIRGPRVIFSNSSPNKVTTEILAIIHEHDCANMCKSSCFYLFSKVVLILDLEVMYFSIFCKKSIGGQTSTSYDAVLILISRSNEKRVYLATLLYNSRIRGRGVVLFNSSPDNYCYFR